VIEVVGDASREGDWALVRLEVDGDRIVRADADRLDRPLAGLTLLEAASVGGEPLAVDALANAIGPIFRAAPHPERVAVAMSGGVDSAVALLRAGPHAIGVTLRLWLDPNGPDAARACCSPEAVVSARNTCHELGLPHVTLDARERFVEAVVDEFVDGYARGETPNPCTRCNGAFRFAELLGFASRAGAHRLATGHYARIVLHRGRRLVARGADRAKDQSYMLSRLEPSALGSVWFPLGDQTKEETRREAAEAGLAAAGRSESQEACFLAGGDYREFLERRGLPRTPGPILDERGATVGHHDGFWRFTPGQRKGLGVAAAGPLYALRTDPRRNAVVVGPRESLAVSRVQATGCMYVPVRSCEAKLRARSESVPARAELVPSGFRLDLERPVYGAALGQTAVLYEGDAVVGSGTICSVGFR
jgi:tRNA-uridine 2-sulfurtransferase